MKCYKVTGGDLFAVSLVEDPAIESNFIALSKQKQIVQLENEKRLLVGAALIPNKPIYRNINGKEFYISFDEATIEKLAQDFLANDYQHNITIAHQQGVDDIVVVESWIKTSENDKSVGYGLNEPIGTWFISVKVNNDEIWNKVKNGDYKGFSIEAMVGLDENLELNNQLSMNEELIEKLREIIYEAIGKTNKAEEIIQDTAKEVIEEQLLKLDAKDEEIAKLKEDIANLVAEVERLKSERDELESKLQDSEASKQKMDEEMKSVKTELESAKSEIVKMSKQPSVEPKRNEQAPAGKNYSAAVKLMLK